MAQTLILYYSQSGNTEKLANIILAEVGGDIGRIDDGIDLSGYDTVFIGTPNHAASAAQAVQTFLKDSDLSGKTVVPFCTHGTGGLQNVATAIESCCPDSTVLPCFAIAGVEVDSAGDKVKVWLKDIGLV